MKKEIATIIASLKLAGFVDTSSQTFTDMLNRNVSLAYVISNKASIVIHFKNDRNAYTTRIHNLIDHTFDEREHYIDTHSLSFILDMLETLE